MGKTKPGFYAVAKGRKVGIYLTWDECKAQVHKFTAARHKKFDTKQQAEAFIATEGGYSEPATIPTEPRTSVDGPNVVSNGRVQEIYKVFSTLAPKDPGWKSMTYKQQQAAKAEAEEIQSKSNTPMYFDKQYSGKQNYRPELAGTSTNTICTTTAATTFLSGQALLEQQKLQGSGTTTNVNNSAPNAKFRGFPKRNISTTSTDYKRNLKVKEDRVTNNKRKFGEISTINFNSMVSNLEKFTIDDDGYVVVFTDGACSSNGKTGAKAGIGVWFGTNHDLNISEPVNGRQTNNTAEIQAAERAILQAKTAGIDKLCVKTDSQFVINCVTKWLPNWKRNGWKAKDGKPVINRVDLEKLCAAMQDMDIKWSYVAGHKGIHGNEQADQLAVQGANKRLKLQ